METRGSSPIGWLVNTIFWPSGDQSASSSMVSGRLVILVAPATPARPSSTFMTKMSLSHVAAPGSVLVGHPGIPGGRLLLKSKGGCVQRLPDADRWNAIFLLSGDHVAELPRVRKVGSVPSVFITNRSEVLRGSLEAWFRVLSNTIFFPSGDKAAKKSPTVFSVSR